MNAHEAESYAFGQFVLIPRERQLRRDGVPVPLAAKAFDVLVALVRNHGRLLSKEALLHEVWPGVIVEEVNLTAAKAVRVAPRPSASRFRDSAVDPQAAGRALGVEAVVTGRVALRDDALDIQVDLVDVARGAQAWGERYHGRASDLPHFQTRVAQDLLQAAGAALTPD